MQHGLDGLEDRGFTLVRFRRRQPLLDLRQIVRAHLGAVPTRWHRHDRRSDDYLAALKGCTDALAASDAVPRLIEANLRPFLALFGPDIDVQRVPHVRVSRPGLDSDQMGWHRDLFYGNSPWELNLWFPLFTLGDGSGLRYLPGSHRLPPTNVRPMAEEAHPRVEKGSLANQLGFVYLPKTDDTIAQLDLADTVLFQPRVGEAVVFFGSGAHRGENVSDRTRITIDVRLKHALAPTGSKPGYYRPLHRGLVERTAQRLLAAAG